MKQAFLPREEKASPSISSALPRASNDGVICVHSKRVRGLQRAGKRRDLFLEKSLNMISMVNAFPTAWLQRAFSAEAAQNWIFIFALQFTSKVKGDFCRAE